MIIITFQGVESSPLGCATIAGDPHFYPQGRHIRALEIPLGSSVFCKWSLQHVDSTNLLFGATLEFL